MAPDLYYFFSLDTLRVIASYPLLALASLALVLGIPLLLWLAWRADAPADFKHHPEPRRRWARRIGLGFGLLVLVTSMTPRGVFGDLYGKPMRSEEHTSELQSLMRISYAVFCLKKK